MRALLRSLMRTMMTLVSLLAARRLSSSPTAVSAVKQEVTDELCLPCEIFFRKLERAENGKLSRTIKVQLRGEPKSGTGIMYDWATAALMRACDYLQVLFGPKSCVVEVIPVPIKPGHRQHLPVIQRMVFEPALGASDARCPCETIESVSIILSQVNKHTLPVNSASCAFSHNQGMDLVIQAKGNRERSVCKFADGTSARNNADLWRCMHEANCKITDDSLQMAIFRDPRPAVVSTYYHLSIYTNNKVGDLEAFIARELPSLCQWLVVRHILFSGMLRHQSMEFWYDEAMVDPLEWYYQWFDSLGLQLPYSVVHNAATAAAADDLGFRHKRFERHPGEKPRNETGVRKFEEEVGPDIRKTADAVLRVWLPPVLLEKLGISTAEVAA